MELVNWIFLPGIISLGIITSIEDLKFGKIRNKWIIYGIFYAILVNLIISIIYTIYATLNTKYIINYLINGAISLFVGFLFYYYDLWSEGDGKLFIAYALLIPLTAYSNYYINIFPSFNLLINIFVPYSIYFIIKSTLKNKEKLKIKIEFKDIPETLIAFIKLFAIQGIISILGQIFKIQSSLIITLTTFIAYHFLLKMKTNQKNINYLLIMLLLLRFIPFFNLTTDIKNILYLFLMFLIYRLLFTYFNIQIRKNTKENISLKHLKENMIVSKNIYSDEKNYLIQSTGLVKGKLIIEEFKKLENNSIKRIRNTKTYKEDKNISISIIEQIPFAHIIFLGVIINLILKANIISIIDYFKYYFGG